MVHPPVSLDKPVVLEGTAGRPRASGARLRDWRGTASPWTSSAGCPRATVVRHPTPIQETPWTQ